MADNKESDNERQKYVKDPRIACKYGTKCYQTNPAHQQKYKHPPQKTSNNLTPSKKKIKMDFKGKDETEVKPSLSDSSVDKKNISNDNKHHPPKKKYKMDFKGKDETEVKPSSSDSSEDKKNISNDDNRHPLEKKYKMDVKGKDDIDSSDSSEDEKNKSNEDNQPEKDTNSSVSNKQISEPQEEIKEDVEIPEVKNPDLGRTPKVFDMKAFIKEKFLVTMPEDFYIFWDFCKKLREPSPQEAFRSIGLTLVGPYDVLAGKFYDVPDQSSEKYFIHWRYFYDPPEFQTVLRGDDKSGFHIGYFRDSPKEMPVYLASNSAKTDGTFRIMGDNMFAAVYLYLEDLKKSGDPFKRMHIGKFQSAIKKRAEELNLNLLQRTPKIRDRERKIVTRSFNKMGIIVPYNRTTQVGYRNLAISNKELVTLLNNIQKALPEQRQKFLSDLQIVLTNVSIATDECDFGTGIELGLDILAHGVESLNHTASRFLATNYQLIDREEFAKIAEAHMRNRKKGSDLSIV